MKQQQIQQEDFGTTLLRELEMKTVRNRVVEIYEENKEFIEETNRTLLENVGLTQAFKGEITIDKSNYHILEDLKLYYKFQGISLTYQSYYVTHVPTTSEKVTLNLSYRKDTLIDAAREREEVDSIINKSLKKNKYI